MVGCRDWDIWEEVEVPSHKDINTASGMTVRVAWQGRHDRSGVVDRLLQQTRFSAPLYAGLPHSICFALQDTSTNRSVMPARKGQWLRG